MVSKAELSEHAQFILSGLALSPSVSKSSARNLLIKWMQDHMEASSGYFAIPSMKEASQQMGKLAETLEAAQEGLTKLPSGLRFELASLIGAQGKWDRKFSGTRGRAIACKT